MSQQLSTVLCKEKRHEANGDRGKALKLKIVQLPKWSKIGFQSCMQHSDNAKIVGKNTVSIIVIQPRLITALHWVVCWCKELFRRGWKKLEPVTAQRRLGAKLSLCLFKGQENRWPRFLRHGSDLSQWHLYQSRASFVLCLTARHICLSCSGLRTEAVYLLSNVSLHFMPAVSWHRVIHKQC